MTYPSHDHSRLGRRLGPVPPAVGIGSARSALVEPVRVSYQLRKDGVKSP